MKRRFFLFVSCFISCLSTTAQTGQFISADRFSSSLINDLCQDRQGSIWIATDYGLNRYDGYRFQTFLHSDADTTSVSDNMVVSLLCDKDGRVWAGCSYGLDCFDAPTESFVHYAFPEGYRPRVSSLIQRHDGTIVVGTAGYGAYTVGDGLLLQPYVSDDDDKYFSRMYEDAQGRFWHSGFNETICLHHANGRTEHLLSTVGNPQAFVEQEGEVLIVCQHGIMAYRNGLLQMADIDMSVAEGRDVIYWKAVPGISGNIYIGTRGKGLFSIPTGQQRRIENITLNTFGLDIQTAKVSAAMLDARGNLWLGCHRKGLVMVPLHPEQFQNWSFEAQGIRLGSTISSVCEGDGGMVWATVQGVGIYGFNEKGRVVAHPKAPNAVEFIFRDKKKRFWVGTDDGLFTYEPQTGSYQQCVTFDCDRFNDMTSDDDGNIYISTFSRGFCIFTPGSGELRNYSMTDDNDSVRGRLCNNWILAMMPSRNGQLWMATASGVACYDPKADTFKPFGWEQLLPGVMCYSLCETSKGHILIGTGNGLYVYEPGKQEATLFEGADELKDKVVNYIVETNDGDLWCSTSMGIWQYDASIGKFIGHVATNGLTKKEYVLNVGMHTDDDRVFFGNNDGLTVFSPHKQDDDEAEADPLVLTAFRVGDQFVNAATELNDVCVTDGKAIAQCDHFTLSYLDHTVSMAFSQYDFENAMNVSLEHRVNNEDWIRGPEGRNEIALAHLQPGTYRIEVRALHQGHYSPSKVIIIKVRAPWYKSSTAYFIYIVILLALFALAALMWRRRANRQLDEEKMKFLINATHDIRSPLTIILSALKKIKNTNVDDLHAVADLQSFCSSVLHPSMDAIERNSQRILNLVNQILDVRKIDKQQMHLHCRKTDMVQFVSSVCKMFEFNAQERNIKLKFDHEGFDRAEVWIDRSQFDKVITNLLSNAFKYTHDGGEIVISLEADGLNQTNGATGDDKQQDNRKLTLRVQDSGVGISPDSLRHIFDRFYQGSNSRKLNIDGTGIGLNLCKMIVDMHHGTIEAQNRTDGKQGSVFTVTLPLGTSHLKPEEIDTETQEPVQHQTVSNQSSSSSSRHKVLIVDDDNEIAEYIQQELQRHYKFGICHNGKDGLKELLTNDYDVVVSDVMMPEMDGFTMLRMIKTNLNLSHLPVIMLTSKADVANRLEGLEHGADAFLAKPFDMKELHLTIENLIQGRRHLKGKFSGAQQQADKLEQPEVKGNDEQLMERIMKVVNKNLSDSDFNVEMLCSEVGISRAQLHRKMKELTGISTSEFIRNIRLEQAARLLKEQKINVTQVAYTVGFSNLAHFSTIFRKHFGVAPSEYANIIEE